MHLPCRHFPYIKIYNYCGKSKSILVEVHTIPILWTVIFFQFNRILPYMCISCFSSSSFLYQHLMHGNIWPWTNRERCYENIFPINVFIVCLLSKLKICSSWKKITYFPTHFDSRSYVSIFLSLRTYFHCSSIRNIAFSIIDMYWELACLYKLYVSRLTRKHDKTFVK